ncbi:ArnT family glycosyltransferase [Nitrospinota bacterium]
MNPGWFKYPPLFLYFLFSSFGLRYVVERALGVSPSSQVFAEHFFANPLSFFVQARFVSAVLGVCAVWLVYLLSRRLSMSRRASSAAALFVALSPILVRLSHFALTDGPMLVPLLISLLFAVRFLRKGIQSDVFLAGLFSGLAAAVKYPAGISIVGILVAAAGRTRNGESISAGRLFAQCGVGLAAGFLIACPWAVSDFGTFWFYVKKVGAHVGSSYLADILASRGYIPYLTAHLPESMTWLIYLAGLSGMIMWLRRDGWPAATVAAPAIVYWLIMGAARNHFPRFSVPLLPALALGAAWWFERPALKGRRGKAVAALALTVLAGPAFASSVLSNVRLAMPDTRAAATEWIEKNVPPGARVLSELYGPRLAYTPDRARKIASEERQLDPKAGGKFAYLASNPPSGRPGYRFIQMPLFKGREGVSQLADDWYDPVRIRAAGVEWIVLTSSVSGRYAGRKRVFPRQAAFLGWLDRCWDEGARFTPSDPPVEHYFFRHIERRGPTLRIFKKKESFTEICGAGSQE